MTAGLPPRSNLDAEAAVLDAMFTRPACIDEVLGVLKGEDFFGEANRFIFNAIVTVSRADKRVDRVTVGHELAEQGRLAFVGGAAGLALLLDSTPAVANVLEHAQIVRDCSRVRRMVAVCSAIAAEGYGDVGEVSSWISDCEQRICAIADEADQRGPEHVEGVIKAVYQDVVNEAEGRAVADPPIPSGIVTIDRALKMRRERLTILGAGTGIGKTSLALQLATGVAIDARIGVLFFSIEMPKKHLVDRALYQRARIDKGRPKASLDDAEWARLTKAGSDMSGAPLWIDDCEEHTPHSIRSSVRRVKAQAKAKGYELGLVVVDYLQLVEAKATGKDSNREQQVSHIARRLKVLSRAENVHVLALAQLNSESEKEDRRPRMRDLRESKAVGMHTDNVILIHNPESLGRSERRVDTGYDAPNAETVTMYVDKQRDGTVGSVELMFFPGQTLFASPPNHEHWSDR